MRTVPVCLSPGHALLTMRFLRGRLWRCAQYAGCLLAGTVAVLSLVEEFGAAAAVTVTLLRKARGST